MYSTLLGYSATVGIEAQRMQDAAGSGSVWSKMISSV